MRTGHETTYMQVSNLLVMFLTDDLSDPQKKKKGTIANKMLYNVPYITIVNHKLLHFNPKYYPQSKEIIRHLAS